MAEGYTGGGPGGDTTESASTLTPMMRGRAGLQKAEKPIMDKVKSVSYGTTDRIFAISSVASSSSSAETMPRRVVVTNEGGVPLTVLTGYKQYDDLTTIGDSGNTGYLHTLLMPGESFSPPIRSVISLEDAATQFAGTAISNVNPKDINSGNLYVDTTDNVASGELNNTTDPVVFEVSAGHEKYYVGDYIRVENEILKVEGTYDDNPTGETVADNHIVVSRGHLGTDPASHSGTPDILLPFFNTREDLGATLSVTDGSGRFSNTNFWGYGRATTGVKGIMPGSIAIKFFEEGAYQELGLSNITAGTITGLAASTLYGLNITCDGGSEFTDLSFTTDATNLRFGGKNGLIEKIQSALNTQYYTAGNLFEKEISVGLVEGDIRFTSKSNLEASAISLGNATGSGGVTNIFGVGRIPAVANIRKAVPAKVPDDSVYNNVTNESTPNTSKFLYDNGSGVLMGRANGRVNYDSGKIEILNAPPNSQFVISATHSSAFSGKLSENATSRINSLVEILVNTPSQKWNGKVGVKAYQRR